MSIRDTDAKLAALRQRYHVRDFALSLDGGRYTYSAFAHWRSLDRGARVAIGTGALPSLALADLADTLAKRDTRHAK